MTSSGGWHNTAEWKRIQRVWRPRFQSVIDAGEALCIECRRPIAPGTKDWHISHIVGVSQALAAGWPDEAINDPTNLSTGHRRCNTSSGGKRGRQVQIATKKQENRYPNW